METIEINQITAENRQRIDDVLASRGNALFASVGPCAPDIDSVKVLVDEAFELRQSYRFLARTAVASRLPIWKPRSNPATSWNGMETTHPSEADELISSIDTRFGTAAIEVGSTSHIDKYISKLSFAWLGARNIDNTGLQMQLATADRNLPIGVKNGLDGRIETALERIEAMRKARGDGASITLIFRGGTLLDTPDKWEDAYIDALDATDGQLIVDLAHGGEMAHDPEKGFNKSVLGQIACFDHVIDLAKGSIVPAGILCEASDAPSQVDPVIPFETAIQKAIELHQAMKLT